MFEVPRRRRTGGTGSTIRVLVAIESTRDRSLLPALQSATPVAGGAFLVARRCMTADQLEAAVQEDQADAVLIGEGLFGLDAATLACCVDAGLPTVVLGSAAYPTRPGVLELPSDVTPSHVCAVLAAAVWGTSEQLRDSLQAAGMQPSEVAPEHPRTTLVHRDATAPTGLGLIVVIAGPPRGNVGATRAAIELTAARERHQSTLLIDAVLDEPSIAAALGLNPARNLTVLAASVAGQAGANRWPRLLREETQLLDQQQYPRAAVLAGVPSPALRHRLDLDFLVELIRQASGPGGFDCVVIDAGAEPPPGTLEGACWHAVVDLADQVLLIALPDVVGLRRAVGTLNRLQARLEPERLGVVLNRYRRAEHDDAADIAAVLGGVPIVAVVPDDVRACTRALQLQRPLLSLGRSAAGRELRRLAEQLPAVQSQATTSAKPTVRRPIPGQHTRWWPWRGWRRR
jgi:MinD-like ATPase involved in chromosome partitioning or flagellar assembly